MEAGSMILSKPLGNGEAIVVTGSGNCWPLVLLTSTTFALTIRFRYVAEMTRFSSSTKLMAGFMLQQTKLIDWFHVQTVRWRPDSVNRKLYLGFSLSFIYPARDGLRSPVSAFSAALLINDA